MPKRLPVFVRLSVFMYVCVCVSNGEREGWVCVILGPLYGFFLSLFADRYGGRCFGKHFEKLLENNSAEVEM